MQTADILVTQHVLKQCTYVKWRRENSGEGNPCPRQLLGTVKTTTR
jgi:hypothetical protein